MEASLFLHDTRARTLRPFAPLSPPHVGLYVCGPTVYGPPHLGHARSGVFFDVLVRHLTALGYQVRYVRNITDVGHLVGDGDEGEDKLLRQARRSQSPPMAVADAYTRAYEQAMDQLHVQRPTIAPRASGHIPEQIAFIERLLDKQLAYVAQGSVYFDLLAYDQQHGYGQLTGKQVKHLLKGSRPLSGQSDKRHPLDFSLWKKAAPDHLMQWPSPWGPGFPGWHIECSAMSSQYLGAPFDIHGGGLDLAFPHHECEMAQSRGALGVDPVRYWVHHNLITIEGRKMSKSLGNYLTLADCFAGGHPRCQRPYPPMVLRLFLLMAHYRSPIDYSEEGLQRAEKNYYKLINGLQLLRRLPLAEAPEKARYPREELARQIDRLAQACYAAMAQDLHTERLVAALLGLRRFLYQLAEGHIALEELSQATWARLATTYRHFVQEILGLAPPARLPQRLVEGLQEIYQAAKAGGQAEQVQQLRTCLAQQGIAWQEGKEKVTWAYAPPEYMD